MQGSSQADVDRAAATRGPTGSAPAEAPGDLAAGPPRDRWWPRGGESRGRGGESGPGTARARRRAASSVVRCRPLAKRTALARQGFQAWGRVGGPARAQPRRSPGRPLEDERERRPASSRALIPGESRAIPSEGSAPGSPRGRRLAPGPREGCRAAIARRRSTGRRLRALPVIEAAEGHDRSARPRAAVRSRSLPDAAAAGSISEPSHGPRGRRTGVPGSPRRGFAAPLQGAPIRRVERAIERLEAGRGRIPTSSPEGLRDPSVKSALLDLAGFDAGSGLPYSRAPLRGPVLPSPRASGGPVV